MRKVGKSGEKCEKWGNVDKWGKSGESGVKWGKVE